MPPIQDDRTTGFNIQKPHPTNLLADDVLRLRNALDAIDTELGNLLSSAEVGTLIQTAIDNLVDAAPGTLDTLNELAAALGDDPNFANTVSSNIAAKASKAGDTFTGTTDHQAGIAVTGKVVERVNLFASAPNATQGYALGDEAITYHTADATQNFVANFTGLSALAVGDCATFAVMVTNGATPYYMTSVAVDGTTTGVTTKWQNTAAPTAGNANAIDTYSATIIKTAATPTYTVLMASAAF